MGAHHSWCGRERSLDGGSGFFRDDMDDETTQPPPSYNVAGLFRAYYLASLNVLKIKYTKFTKKNIWFWVLKKNN